MTITLIKDKDKDEAAFIIVKSNRSNTQQASRRTAMIRLISCHAGQQREVRHGP